MNTFICYDRCSTCKKAEDFLKAHNVSFEKRPIKEQNPSVKEIHEMKERSGLPLKRFFNTSGQLYKSMELKDKLPQYVRERAGSTTGYRRQAGKETYIPCWREGLGGI